MAIVKPTGARCQAGYGVTLGLTIGDWRLEKRLKSLRIWYANTKKIIPFAKDSDQLFIEGAFRETHKDIAEEKHHLTAWQAGYLAGKAGVKQFTLFHFSPRYIEEEHRLQEEAMEAYKEAMC